MDKLSRLLKNLNERDPCAEDLQRIRSIAEALGADENDTFLALLAALDHYYGLYTKIPKAINDSNDAVAKNVREQIALLKSIVQDASKQAAKRTFVRCIAGCVIACTLVVGGMGCIFHHSLEKTSMRVEGIINKNIKYNDILQCRKRGWIQKDGFCYPQEYVNERGQKTMEGWEIPIITNP